MLKLSLLINGRSSALGKYYHGESNLETIDGAIISAGVDIQERD